LSKDSLILIQVITELGQISIEWLNSVLTRSGALTHGAVQSFELGAGQGNWSTSANLKVRYYDDYRLCAVMGVYIATEYCRGGINESWTHVWLPMLQRVLTACDDLDCQALWRE
jgi:hypothetical protein